jgi:hypothetical protein
MSCWFTVTAAPGTRPGAGATTSALGVFSHQGTKKRRSKMRALITCLFVLVIALPGPVQPQSPTRPEILILGTYHMASPGRDVHNMEADDVLSATRQREIAELIDVLRRFRPTKVAVESRVSRRGTAERYADYLAGEYTLSRNEIDQLGFRLAKEVGHEAIYPVDEDGEFPYYRVLNYAKANGLEAQFDSLRAITATRVTRDADFLRSHTLLEMLQFMNSDSAVAQSVAEYYAFVPFGDPYDYAGPDLIARWFERNVRIYRNIRALITSPDDRILVIYGSGHLGWLQQNVENDASVQLRKLSDLINVSQ